MTDGAKRMESHDPYLPKPPPGQDELPCSDGEPMDTPRHRRQMNLLIESLELTLGARDDVYVGGDMFVWYSELQTKKKKDFRGPDVFVVLGAIAGRTRKSWVVWEEDGKLPDVVIELTSPTTEHIDRGEKKQIYERIWRLPEYFIFDPDTKALDGWRLIDGRYVPIDADARGELECRALGLRLGVREGVFQREETAWLRWIDPATGLQLPTSTENLAEAERRLGALTARAEEEKARADEEKARADEERARADALAAEVAELRRRAEMDAC